jgi:hypothetical protein
MEVRICVPVAVMGYAPGSEHWSERSRCNYERAINTTFVPRIGDRICDESLGQSFAYDGGMRVESVGIELLANKAWVWVERTTISENETVHDGWLVDFKPIGIAE